MNERRDDYRKLMSAVLRQAMDDYVKMQHPKYRRRKYEKEAFWSARDLLWDDGCVLHIKDEEGGAMTLRALAQAAADRENVDLDRLHTYLLEYSRTYWEQKDVKTLEIPEDVVIEGHTYRVEHADELEIDYDNKVLSINKKSPTAEEDFVRAMMDLVCHHGEIRTSAKARRELGKGVYRLLRINSCFTGEN